MAKSIDHIMTSNVGPTSQPSLPDIIAMLERVWAEPFVIGHLWGYAVYLDREQRILYYIEGGIRHDIGSVDSPLIAGTRLHLAAKAALNERS